MCSRYALFGDDETREIQRIIEEINRRYTGAGEALCAKEAGISHEVPVKRDALEFSPNKEAFPTDILPVYVTEAGRPSLRLMRWGFQGYQEPLRPDRKPRPIINARSETVGEKPMFRRPMASGRCLIPAAHYFEWEKRGKERIKYAIGTPEEGLLYMAGVYRVEDRATHPVFAILTRDAAPCIRFVHDRMPVIFTRDARKAWMHGETDVQGLFQAAVDAVSYHTV